MDERAVAERYAGRIRAYGLRHLRDGSAADDLVQQVLLSVLQALREGRVMDTSNLDPYVFGTARNMVHDLRRGTERQQRIADATKVASPGSYEPPWEALDRSRLEHCLSRLEARSRTVILATFVDERDADEVGRSMSLTAGNVRVIRHRALATLHQCIEGGDA